MERKTFSNKEAALAFMTDQGYLPGMGRNSDYVEGECGDNGWGSRLYFHRGEHCNQYGVARDNATLDWFMGEWHFTSFLMPEDKSPYTFDTIPKPRYDNDTVMENLNNDFT